MTPEEKDLLVLKKKIIKISLIGSVGAILLVLGLYGMFDANGDAFHPLLNDQVFVKGLLIVGGVIEVWQFYVIIPMLIKHGKKYAKK